MSAPPGYISTKAAADEIGCSQSKIRVMFHAGDLAGITGTQPQRRRIYIRADENGRPLTPSGSPVSGSPPPVRLAAIEERLGVVEASIGVRNGVSSDIERLQDASRLLHRVIERLQAEANRELTDAVIEQEA